MGSQVQAPGMLLRRVSGPLTALLACGVARHAEAGVIELFLDAAEIATGGVVTISLRVPRHCPACGPQATGPCARCGGTRITDEAYSAWLAVRPGVADGT